MPSDHVRPLGVVFLVNDVPYVTMFDNTEPLTVTYGSTVTIAIDGITTEPWAGVDNMVGMLPLVELQAPVPPQFQTVEEAEAWLDQYPSRL